MNTDENGLRPEPEDRGFEPVMDVAFDLTKGEKLRTTALMLAIRFYTDTIVKDAQMYQTMMAGGKNMRPASSEGVIEVAANFELYIQNGVVEFSENPDGKLKIVFGGGDEPTESMG